MITIIKPKFDLRKFIGGKLDNGIKYVLIHDKQLEKSFVSVAIKAGSFLNPKDYNGLAHFLEHMLFMGSKKYPDESHYSDRLNELGGYSNAYTDTRETVYYFEVFDNGLAEIIDIFSRFFIDPLFNPSSVNREINAVDSEHLKNINNDYWKRFQLMLDLTNKNSNTNVFITGSLNSLNKDDLREKMIDFFNKHYTADNISICISSSKSIKDQFDIIKSTFGKIKKTISTNPLKFNKPFYSDNKRKTFYLKSSINTYEITYTWEIPVQNAYIDSDDYGILRMILTNRSEKSIYHHLKNMGYLNNIIVEVKYEGTFNITLDLTKDGYSNLSYIDAFLLSCLENILKLDLTKYADYYKKVTGINFDCLNKFNTSDLCNLLSVNHHTYPTKTVFQKGFIITHIKSTIEYQREFNQHFNNKNLIRLILSQHSEIFPDIKKYSKTREYDAEYTEIKFKKKSKLVIPNVVCDMDLENSYLDVKPVIYKSLKETPKLVKENQWYGGYSDSNEPFVDIYMLFGNENYFNNSKNYILTYLACSVINFMLSYTLSKPLELGYNISFSPKSSLSLVVVNIGALNDISKLKMLLRDLFNFIDNLEVEVNKITDKYIINLIDSLRDGYLNTKFLNPWEYLSYFIKTVTYNNEYSIDELINQLNTITIDEIKDYIINLLKDASLTTFLYGNTNNIDDLFINFKDHLKRKPNNLPLIDKINNISIKHPNPKEKSECLGHYYYIGKFDPELYLLLSLTVNILSQPFFNLLRTKYQLGYLVRLSIIMIGDDFYIIQKVQSDKGIDIINEKIEEFNSTITKIIEDSDIETFIDSLKNELIEPEYNLSQKVDRYLSEIILRKYLFNRKDILLKKIDTITKRDIFDFVKKYLVPKNKVNVSITI